MVMSLRRCRLVVWLKSPRHFERRSACGPAARAAGTNCLCHSWPQKKYILSFRKLPELHRAADVVAEVVVAVEGRPRCVFVGIAEERVGVHSFMTVEQVRGAVEVLACRCGW